MKNKQTKQSRRRNKLMGEPMEIETNSEKRIKVKKQHRNRHYSAIIKETQNSLAFTPNIKGYKVIENMKPIGNYHLFKVFHIESGKRYLLYCYDKKRFHLDPELKVSFDAEIAIHMGNDKFIEVKDFFQDDRNYYLLVEYISDLNMKELMEREENKRFNEHQAVFYLIQMIMGVKDLRKQFIYSRCFDLRNMFLCKGQIDKVKLGFIGLFEDNIPTKAVDGFCYMPYEVLEGYVQGEPPKLNSRTDLWGIGCVLYEMLTGKHAFYGLDNIGLLKHIKRRIERGLELPEFVSDEAKELIRGLLQIDPNKRTGWSGLLQSKLINKYVPDFANKIKHSGSEDFEFMIWTELTFKLNSLEEERRKKQLIRERNMAKRILNKQKKRDIDYSIELIKQIYKYCQSSFETLKIIYLRFKRTNNNKFISIKLLKLLTFIHYKNEAFFDLFQRIMTKDLEKMFYNVITAFKKIEELTLKMKEEFYLNLNEERQTIKKGKIKLINSHIAVLYRDIESWKAQTNDSQLIPFINEILKYKNHILLAESVLNEELELVSLQSTQ